MEPTLTDHCDHAHADTRAETRADTLVLFDIDGTILRSEGAGVAAMLCAFTLIHGDRGFTFEGLEIAGALDRLLFNRLMAQHDLPSHDEAHDHFRMTYRLELERTLSPERVRRMPGVLELALALIQRDVAVGLLTGNYEETAHIKIRAAGIDPGVFPFGAFGSDGASRRHLTPVAMTRAHAHHGRAFAANRVTIIGDTPSDVDCAKAHGCRSIGVATGPFSAETLAQSGADLAINDLSDTEMLLRWILN